MYHWTMDDALKMRAALFFESLTKGRKITGRQKAREYYNLCRISLFPQLTEEGRKEVNQFYWDQSLSDIEAVQNLEFQQVIEEKARAGNLLNQAALSFFKGQSRGKKR